MFREGIAINEGCNIQTFLSNFYDVIHSNMIAFFKLNYMKISIIGFYSLQEPG